MKRKTSIAAAAVAVLVVVAGLSAVIRQLGTQQHPDDTATPNPTGWMALPEDEICPEGFEPYLAEHPDDEDRRTAALIWYSRRQKNIERLKHHTFEMIKYHPASMHIHFANTTPFYREPDYRNAVIARLEQQVQRGNANSDVYWILAMACEQGALPRKFDDEESRKRFLRYFELSEDTPLPTDTNDLLADKALRYFRLAIDTAHGESRELYAKQLVELLLKLDKPVEGAEIGQAMLESVPTLKENASFLYAYGWSLKEMGQKTKAEKTLKQVQQFDHEGHGGGPACTTMRAELMLGGLALEGGEIKSAAHHLIASLDVQRCCHNSTQGVSLKLAKQLLENGEYTAVIEFCETALQEFVPGQPETAALLARARSMAGE